MKQEKITNEKAVVIMSADGGNEAKNKHKRARLIVDMILYMQTIDEHSITSI